MSWDGIQRLGRDAAAGETGRPGLDVAADEKGQGRGGWGGTRWLGDTRIGTEKTRTEVVEGCEKTCATPLDVRGGTAGLTVPGNRDQKTE